MFKFNILLFLFILMASPFKESWLQQADAHCQIPCGIYDDHSRIHQMQEHAQTIEKAMSQIVELAAKQQSALNMNQLVRWVNAKEEHAQKIQDLVSEYFLAQRIKESMKKKHYEKLLKLAHALIQGAMKCKQTTDIENVKSLNKDILDFGKIYKSASKK